MSSNDGLYDWDWSDPVSVDTIEATEEERYEPDRPPDDEFYWAERLRLNNEKKNTAQDSGYLRVYEGPGQSRPINNADTIMDKANAIAKRSNGYQTVAQVPSVQSSLSNPYSKSASVESRPPVPALPNLVKASSIQRTQTPVTSPYYPPAPEPVYQLVQQQQYEQPIQVQVSPDVRTDYKPHNPSYADIESGVNQEPIPVTRKRIEPAKDARPRLKVTRQLFLAIAALEIANTRDVRQLEKLTKKMIECVIPNDPSDNEICLYNADEVVRQLVIQIASTRDEDERIVLFKAASKIIDMYVPMELQNKEFIQANNTSYPHPAYVGLQASLDLLNYISIWVANLASKNPTRQVPVGGMISVYLNKYRKRLNRMPSVIGEGLDQTVMYYE